MTEQFKLRWYQFRLRTLMVFVLVASAMLGWLGIKLEQGRRQQRVVKVLENAGASVIYDFQTNDMDRPPYWPEWLVDAIGEDYFASVKEVIFPSKVTEIDLEHLKSLTDLRDILLSRPVSDEQMQRLRKALPKCQIGYGGIL